MNNVNQAIAAWLAQSNAFEQTILARCHFDYVDTKAELTILCPSDLYKTCSQCCERLSWLSAGSLIKRVLLTDGDRQTTFAPDSSRIYQPFEGIMELFAPRLALPLNFDNPIAIVEMGTNRGLFCTKQVARNARTTADQWLDEDMAKYHYPQELRRLVEALEAHTNITAFEYRAIAFDGTPIRNVVNASLTKLGDRWVRVVETISSEQV